MKKYRKSLLIMAGICLFFGAAVTAAAAISGGKIPEKISYEGLGAGHREDQAQAERNLAGKDMPETYQETAGEASGETFAVPGELELIVQGGGLKLVQGDAKDVILLEHLSQDMEYRQELEKDGELKLTFKRKNSVTQIPSDSFPDVVLLLPADFEFEEVKLEAEAGRITTEAFSARKIDLESAAGSIEVYGASAEELEADCQAGAILFAGDVQRELEADCQTGAVELRLSGNEEDFFYELETKTGKITVNDTEYTGLMREKTLPNAGAVKHASLECETGSISLKFDK